jgi:hypothetical protein
MNRQSGSWKREHERRKISENREKPQARIFRDFRLFCVFRVLSSSFLIAFPNGDIDGQIYAMTGAGAPHNRIAGNIFNRLDEHLADDQCEPFPQRTEKQMTFHNSAVN